MLLGHIPTCDAGPHILAIHLAHQAALEQAVQDHAPPATTIYQTQLNNLQAQWGEGVANDARTTQSFLRTARRRIARTFPEIPAHAAQLDVDAIPHKYQVIVTNQVEQLFLMHFEVIGNAPAAGPDNRETYLVFCTEVFFRMLCEAPRVNMDGTFKTCPRPFVQLFTLHIPLGPLRSVPAMYVLCNRKTQVLYNSLFA